MSLYSLPLAPFLWLFVRLLVLQYRLALNKIGPVPIQHHICLHNVSIIGHNVSLIYKLDEVAVPVGELHRHIHLGTGIRCHSRIMGAYNNI